MKKICIFISLLFAIFIRSDFQLFCSAKAEVSTYGKVHSECVLYKTPTINNEIDNILFIVPETYFVMIIDSISDNCYKVQYGDYVGYIDSTKITIATFIPIVKTLDGVVCDIKDSSGTQVWSKPSANSSIFTTIPASTKNIKYIASVYGEKPNGGENNLWYYISYTPENNSTNVYEGYVYSENITNLSEIISNTETNPEVINNNSIDENTIYISSPVKIILISIVAIPIIILFLIILHKISKIFQNKKSNQNNNVDIANNSNQFINFNNSFENTNQNNQFLRNEIQNMSRKPFVRKINQNQPRISQNSSNNYPRFPYYDSDDDLL